MMESELAALEAKIAQVVELCRSLRSENSALRNELARTAGERDHLAGKLAAARERLTGLLANLPDQ